MAVGLALCLVGVFEPMKLGSLETVLLVVSLGFLGFAAHCMDRADERKRAEWK
jgi:heme/copper-type cytochrome/quinol oxidase subunit 3